MTVAELSAPIAPQAPDTRGSTPTRWKVTAVIMAVTTVILVVGSLLAYANLLRDVDARADTEIAEGIESFRAFASGGVDPTTSVPFDGVAGLLRAYLDSRPGEKFGVVGGEVVGAPSGDLEQAVEQNPSLIEFPTAEDQAGVVDTAAGPMRWVRVDVDGPDGTRGSLFAVTFTESARAEVHRTMLTTAVAGAVGLIVLAGAVHFIVSGSRVRVPMPSAMTSISGAVVMAVCGRVIMAGAAGELSADAVVTLVVFAVAVWAWIFAPIDDTYVALGAALSLVVLGPVDADTFTGTLGDTVIWLLVGSFVIAAAVTASGLSARVAARVLTVARSPRQLVHLVTFVLLVTTFAIPATSGRAALALPVFLALATALRARPALVLALAIVFPAVILFSAIGSLLGAGAHLITSEILRTATGSGIDFLTWMMLGLPLALLWSHAAAEIALSIFTDRSERATPLALTRNMFDDAGASGPLTRPQRRMIALLGIVVAAWCSEPVHGVDPAIVAMIGALIASAPRMGATTLPAAIKTIPWALLLFMAATLCLGVALTTSGAAEWFAGVVFEPIRTAGTSAATVFVAAVVVVSLLAHLFVQSRSARSAVLVPIVVASAPALGIDPAAAAFASTAAAGFCMTLTSSAKPVALFAASETVPGYSGAHLLRFSAALAPVSIALILLFSLWVWPALGLPLYSS